MRRGAARRDPTCAPRFVGGHPMAGSEQDGLDGADADLFAGATWVLTPTADTDPTAHTAVRSVVGRLGAEVVEIPPEHHDALVAVVSHVPQLAATTLMDVAATTRRGARAPAAARGRRVPGHDPDRGRPSGDLAGHLRREPRRDPRRARRVPRRRSTRSARWSPPATATDCCDVLERGRARSAQPARRAPRARARSSELRVPVPDRPGVLAEVTTLAEPARREHRRHRDRALDRRARAVCSCCVVPDRRRRPGSTPRSVEAGYHVSRTRRCAMTHRPRRADVVTAGGRSAGRLRLPGCKGISHRALLFAAHRRRPVARSAAWPTAPTLPRPRRAGSARCAGPRLDGDTAVGRPGAGFDGLREPETVLDCGNSGTTMRMLAGLLAGRDVPLGARRRRVAVRAGRCGGCSSRWRRWARASTAATAARSHRSRSWRRPARGPPRAGDCERPGEDRARARRSAGRRVDRGRRARRRAVTTPSGCWRPLGVRDRSAERPRRAGRRAEPPSVRARRARRPVVGRVLRRRGVHRRRAPIWCSRA